MSQFSNFAKPFFDWLEKSAKLASNWLETKPRAVSYGRIHVTNFKTTSSTKALRKLCTKLYQSPAKAPHEAPYKALLKLYQKLYQRLCSTSAHPVYWSRGEWSTQCAAGSKGVSPLKLWSKLCLRPYTELQSSTNTSTNILGRFRNRPYNRPYDQLPYNRLYERLYERLYKRLHDRPYEPHTINQLNAHTIAHINISTNVSTINHPYERLHPTRLHMAL